MSTTTMVHVRVEAETKVKAAEALAAMGLSVSDAVRVFLKRVAEEKALPFEVRVPNAKTKAAMRELNAGKARRFGTVGELMADLDADD